MIVRFSSLYRLKVACAWHRRFIAFLKDKSSVRKGGIAVDELEAAELRLVAYVQRQVFAPVFKILKSEVRPPNKVIKRELKRNSQLRCLFKTSPILFEGLLRVGGRLESATMDFSAKHPAILPCQHHLTNLLIRYHHVKCGHSENFLYLDFNTSKILDFKGKSSRSQRIEPVCHIPQEKCASRSAADG